MGLSGVTTGKGKNRTLRNILKFPIADMTPPGRSEWTLPNAGGTLLATEASNGLFAEGQGRSSGSAYFASLHAVNRLAAKVFFSGLGHSSVFAHVFIFISGNLIVTDVSELKLPAFPIHAAHPIKYYELIPRK